MLRTAPRSAVLPEPRVWFPTLPSAGCVHLPFGAKEKLSDVRRQKYA
jgi:hypothetical protein